MALSGTINNFLTAGQLIDAALMKIGVLGQGFEASADEFENARQELNWMLKSWSVDGPNLWTVAEQTVTLVSGTQTYTLSPRPRFVMNARLAIDGVESRPLAEWNRQDWDKFPSKATTGLPSIYVLDRTRTATTITFWPKPTFSSGTYTVLVGYERALEIVEVGANEVDIPEELMETAVMCLAARLLEQYRIEDATAQTIRQRAALLYNQAMMFDRNGDIRFVLRR